MSRKGIQPIALPKGVDIKVNGTNVTVKGPKGTLEQEIKKGITVKVEGDNIVVGLEEAHADQANFWGLYRSLIANMVTGVVQGFETKLEMIGVGYRAAVQGQLLDLQLGFSHPTKLSIPAGLTVKVEKNTAISVTGANKQEVGQFAAKIRSIRPPEPYQGKGVRYVGEYVRKKAGKAAAKSK